jgi:diguanylate cyclase
MKHTDDIAQAISLLKQTLPEMNKRNIASTPNNYAIWYEYVMGDNQKLISAIKALDNQKAIFTSEVLNKLYSEFISDAHEAAVNKLSNSVREIILGLLDKASTEGQDLSNYAQTLASFSSQVEDVKHLDDIKELIHHLLNETKKREEATQSMQTSLEGMALEMKKLRLEVAKINSEASTDALTKINNRRAFDIEIEGFITMSKADSKPLCLIMVDIDHFKHFNEKFSHSVGDKVLRFVASLIKNNIKGSDSVSRYSGEQFAILLPETNFEGALKLAEIIREKLAKQTLSDSAEKKELGTITASFGVGTYEQDESSDQLIMKANNALQDAKKTGRNKVIGNKSINNQNSDTHRTIL